MVGPLAVLRRAADPELFFGRENEHLRGGLVHDGTAVFRAASRPGRIDSAGSLEGVGRLGGRVCACKNSNPARRRARLRGEAGEGKESEG